MTMTTTGAAGADKLARIKSLLGKYPAVDEADLIELLHWFRHQASALDVGLIASEAGLETQYQLFKREHIARVSPRELTVAAFVSLGLAAALALAVYASL